MTQTVRHYCTYFDKNYLLRGLALYRSLNHHARPFTLYVLCMDDVTIQALKRLARPNLVLIPLNELERYDSALPKAKENRSRIEYYFTCTPSLPLYILRHFPDIDVITYLDADLFFYSSPSPIYLEFGHKSILIIPHRYPPHLGYLNERYGNYNVGLLAFRNDTYARQCLEWWRERCLEWCYDRFEEGKFADQKYLDDWPERFDRVHVLGHKGAGLGPWNVATSTIEEANGSLSIFEEPVIFYHFHGLKQINRLLFDTGLHNFHAQAGSKLLNQLYGPYIRELQSLGREMQLERKISGLRGRTLDLRGMIYLLLRQHLCLVLGPFCREVSLHFVGRQVDRFRRLARHAMSPGGVK